MRNQRIAFTLVEVMVVVVVLGVLAMVVVPRFATARSDSSVTAAAEDIKGIVRAIEFFNASKGYWPIDTKAGQVPPEVKSQFKSDNPFEKPCPIGGVYDYDNIASNNAIFLTIRSTSSISAPNIVDAQALDAYLDDGILNQGKFRSTSSGGYTYRFADR